MRSLLLIFTLVFLSSCVLESTIQTSDFARTDQLDNNDDNSRDHSNDDPITKDPTSIPVILNVNSSNITTKISEEQNFAIGVKAQDDFQSGTVNITISYGDIDQKYTLISLDQTSIDLAPGEEKMVNLKIKTETMSASFEDKNVRVSFSDNSSNRTPVHYDFKLTVLPELEIKLLKGGNPNEYSFPKDKNNICFRDHGTPLKVSVVNRSDDFEVGVDNWRMHSAGGRFSHSMPNDTIRKGETFTPVVSNANSNVASFYNHEGGDNTSRRLHFKVAVGDEENVCAD